MRGTTCTERGRNVPCGSARNGQTKRPSSGPSAFTSSRAWAERARRATMKKSCIFVSITYVVATRRTRKRNYLWNEEDVCIARCVCIRADGVRPGKRISVYYTEFGQLYDKMGDDRACVRAESYLTCTYRYPCARSSLPLRPSGTSISPLPRRRTFT